MDPRDLKDLLEKVQKGAITPDEAAARLATLPYEDLGFAKLDHHRALRRGFPEAVFGSARRPSRSRRSSGGSPRAGSACW
jgi:NCAIR mutase (PurE)-related protein